MANYYKRQNASYNRASVTVSEDKNLKWWVQPAILVVTIVLALVLNQLGATASFAVIPAIVGTILLVGTINQKREAVYPAIMAVWVPILLALMNDSFGAGTIKQVVGLLTLVVLVTKYRRYVWKTSTLFVDINLLIVSYYLAVTNLQLDVVSIGSTALSIAVTCALDSALVLALKAMFTDRTIYKLTK